MPEYLRALVFVLFLGGLTFAVTLKPLSLLAGRQRILGWIGIWVALTICFFLARNFWIVVLVSTIILLISMKREADRTVLFLLVFCMTPTTAIVVPGFGVVNYLLPFAFQDFLTLLLLVPVLLSGSTAKGELGKASRIMLYFYCALLVILTFRGTTFTDTLRFTFGLVLSMLVPFLAFSTAVNTEAKMKAVIHVMIFAAICPALVGVFEMVKHWHLYESAFRPWGMESSVFSGYLLRDGQLRASGPMLEPIPFGTLFMVGIGFCLALPIKLLSTGQRTLLIALLLGGLASPIARGPWLGAVVILVVFYLIGSNPVRHLSKLAIAGAACIFLLILTPIGDRVINLLPYVGSEESTVTADYRSKLLENSWIVIRRNPLFGSVDYLETPEMQEMIQGQGIIDVVNTYLQVALATGLAGLGLFVLFFVTVLAGLARAFRAVPESHADLKLTARALFATLCGMLATIFTVSSVGQIPYLYWILAGLCVAQTRIIRAYIEASRLEAPATTTPEMPSSAKPDPVRRAPGRGRILRG